MTEVASGGRTDEWVVGRIRAPMYVYTDEKPVRPDVVLCVEAQTGLVLGSNIVLAGESHAAVAEAIRQASHRPMVRGAKPPRRIRVADEVLAEALRRELDDVEIYVGATPEVDAAAGALSEYLRNQSPSPTYLDGGRVAASAVGPFFEATAALYHHAPWRDIPDDMVISVTAPAFGLHGGCISVVGALGESLGFILFNNLADFRRFSAAARRSDEQPLGVSLFAVSYEAGSALHRAQRREISKHRWTVADANAYPTLMCLDPDLVYRPVTESDYALATACTAALAHFWQKHRPMFSDAEPAPITEVMRYGTHADEIVELTAPHPEATLVFRDMAENSDEEALRAAALDEDDLDADPASVADLLVDSFLDAQHLDGSTEDFCDVAELLCGELLRWRREEMDGHLLRWTAAQVEYFMLEQFPERMGGDDAAVGAVPDILVAFFKWLADEGHLTAQRSAIICRRIAKVRSKFLKRAREPAPSLAPLVQLPTRRHPTKP